MQAWHEVPQYREFNRGSKEPLSQRVVATSDMATVKLKLLQEGPTHRQRAANSSAEGALMC